MVRTALVVNSCYAFAATTLPRILSSAKEHGIPPEDIYVVVGEMDDPEGSCETSSSDTLADGETIVMVDYVNIDYNAAIYLTQTAQGRTWLAQYTHLFYIHDTCELLSKFWPTVCARASTCDTYVKLVSSYSQNMGLFSVPWFLEQKTDLLATFINRDPSLKLAYKSSQFPNETEIRQRFPGLPPTYLGEDALFWFTDEGQDTGDYFCDEMTACADVAIYHGVTRRAVVYQCPGIIKYASTCINGYSFAL